MLNKLKENEKLLEFVMTIAFGTIASFYIIYKLSSSILMVALGLIFISIGYFTRDTEEVVETRTEQLTIFSEEVVSPSIIVNNSKIKKSKKIKA